MPELQKIRVMPAERFTVLRNQAVRDGRLSYRARGLLAWLLSHSWGHSVSAREISEAGKEGRDAIRAALAELEAAGYISRQRLRAQDGTFRHLVTVSDTVENPVDSAVENLAPGTGNPAPVFQAI